MRVSINKALNFFNSVYNEDVNQIFASTVQPVVERSSTFGKLQVQDVDLLQNLFGFVECLATTLSQRAEPVPLVADALTASIHADAIVIVQCADVERRIVKKLVIIRELKSIYYLSS